VAGTMTVALAHAGSLALSFASSHARAGAVLAGTALRADAAILFLAGRLASGALFCRFRRAAIAIAARAGGLLCQRDSSRQQAGGHHNCQCFDRHNCSSLFWSFSATTKSPFTGNRPRAPKCGAAARITVYLSDWPGRVAFVVYSSNEIEGEGQYGGHRRDAHAIAAKVIPVPCKSGEKSSDFARIGSAGMGQTRTFWDHSLILAIPFSR